MSVNRLSFFTLAESLVGEPDRSRRTPMPKQTFISTIRLYSGPLLLAIVATTVILHELDPAGDYPHREPGPGQTTDEFFNVRQGVYLVGQLDQYGIGLLAPESIKDVFGHPGYLPDHPPLARLWLGLSHAAARRVDPPQNHAAACVTACARSGSAVAFGLLIGIVGCFCARCYGAWGGIAGASALICMPRLFGHAHLAALETITGLFFTLSVLAIAQFWNRESPPGARSAVVCGSIWGLLLLTKIQAVLLPLPVAIWAFYRWKFRAIKPMCVWTISGGLLFFAGWPWLWLAPVDHLLEYFARTTDRSVLQVWYAGARWADHDVPWHYPWVLFAVTVPAVLHLLGLAGLWGRLTASSAGRRSAGPTSTPEDTRRAESADRPRSDVVDQSRPGPREYLLAVCIVCALLVFSIPGVAVYDGARLFLVVFPLWAVLIGRGAAVLATWLEAHWSRRAPGLVLVPLLSVQAYGLVQMHPCYLSYYNLTVGGLSGATRHGFEVSYWGDGLIRPLIDELVATVPSGAVVDFVPVAHPFLLPDLVQQAPGLRRKAITLRALDHRNWESVRYLLFFRRRADLPQFLQSRFRARLLAEVRRDGVQLAALYAVDPKQIAVE